jgi:hypothetical protein
VIDELAKQALRFDGFTSGLQALMRIADDELDPVQAAILDRTRMSASAPREENGLCRGLSNRGKGTGRISREA